VDIYLAVVIIVFGPIILFTVTRRLADRARRHFAKAELLSPAEWLRKYGLKRSSSPKWALPERTAGQHWKN